MLPSYSASSLAPDPIQVLRAEQQRQLRRRHRLQAILFLLTLGSTILAGAQMSATWWGAIGYAICIMGILTFHEFGHYFAARHYGVKATLPYFIPFPNLFGTFGAVIKMQGLIPHRKALFDIGVMGPFAGVILALPITALGIALSKVQVVPPSSQPMLQIGDSLLFMGLTRLIHGPLPVGSDLFLHPIGMAGWAGLFVTALNLLPMGQLDGGHLVYAMLRQRSIWVYRIVFAIFALVIVLLNHKSWIFFLLIILFMIRLKHPPTLDDDAPLGRRRVIYGVLALLFFLLTFPPNPIQLK